MSEFKFIEPKLIKAGSDNLRLGFWQQYPKADCRVISEDNYQYLIKIKEQRNEMLEMLKRVHKALPSDQGWDISLDEEIKELIKEATEI